MKKKIETKINLSKKKEDSCVANYATYLNEKGKGKNLIMRIMKETRKAMQKSWSDSGWDRGGWDRDSYDRISYDRISYDRIGYDRDGYDRFS